MGGVPRLTVIILQGRGGRRQPDARCRLRLPPSPRLRTKRFFPLPGSHLPRHQGVVERIKDSFGFIEYVDLPQTVFFHCNQCARRLRSAGGLRSPASAVLFPNRNRRFNGLFEGLAPGDEVDFCVSQVGIAAIVPRPTGFAKH